MTDPKEIARAIEEGYITDYDGFLEVLHDGQTVNAYSSIDEDVIRFMFATHVLTEWLLGLDGDVRWTVEWHNK